MPMGDRMARFHGWGFPAAALIILAAQNLAIFWGHYFGDVGFPWDFLGDYYAWTAFWTTALQKGIFPQWNPFQQMGYPLALNPQIGIYYPPLWWFPLLHLQYTLHDATVVQCLHVLAGSIGMWLLLKALVDSPKLALIGAFAFQCFGGFYCNAEHVDILRAFALAPWIYYAFTFERPGTASLPRRVLLIPVLIYLLATGGYPGNLIATSFVMGCYVVLQLLAGRTNGKFARTLVAHAAAVGGLAMLGAGLSAIQLGPLIAWREQFMRMGTFANQGSTGFPITDWPSLFLSNKLIKGEGSMSSAYVTLPIVLFAFNAEWEALRNNWTHLGVGLLGAGMAGGNQSYLWIALTNAVPTLRFSRFPSSDYRVFIAIAVILLALLGLGSLTARSLSRRSMIGRTGLAILVLTIGAVGTYKEINATLAAAALIGAAAFSLAWALVRRRTLAGRWLVAGVLALIALDAIRVLPDMETWRKPQISSYYSNFGWPYLKDSRLVTFSIFDNLPTRRPARQEANVLAPAFTGLIGGGRYVTNDETESDNLLWAPRVIEQNPTYLEFMEQPWTSVVADLPSAQAPTSAQVAPALLAKAGSNEPGSVVSRQYGINETSYQVSLPAARLVIENEVYFPGWKAQLVFRDHVDQVAAIPVNQVFRGWWLPAGDYVMNAQFEFPDLAFWRSISLLSAVLYLGVLISCCPLSHKIPRIVQMRSRDRFRVDNSYN